MTSFASNNPAPFLQTTQVFPEDQSQLMIKLTDVYSDIANAMNSREISLYDLQQLITGQLFFDPANNQNKKNVFRHVYQITSINPGATLTSAHGISGLKQFTRMYGTCVAGGFFLPIPYTDATAVTNQVSLYADATNFYIHNGATEAKITSGILVLEYLLD